MGLKIITVVIVVQAILQNIIQFVILGETHVGILLRKVGSLE